MEESMKRQQYPVIITFTALMAIFCLFSLFSDSDGFSAFENRELADKPVLTASSYFSVEFEEDYEEYLLDNFMLRDLSVMGYQAYTGMFFLDAFSQSEDVLMSVNVDDFVSAPEQAAGEESVAGGQGLANEQGTGDKQGEANMPGEVNIPGQGEKQAANEQQGGGRTISNGEQRSTVDGQNGATGQSAIGGGQSIDGTSEGGHVGPGHAGVGQSGAGQAETGQLASGQTGTGTSGESSTFGSNQSTDGADDKADDDYQGDRKLTNSLIISADRIMMPTGAYGLKNFGRLLAEAAELMPEVNFYSITGPTSAAFYASENYSTGNYNQSKAEAIISANAGGVKVVKAYDKLMAHRGEDIYFRSDVHWTALGAYYAYEAFCEAAQIQPASLSGDFAMGTYEPFLGGLYSQIYKLPQAARLKSNPEQLDYYIPKIDYKMTLYKMGNLEAPYSVDSIINTNFKSLGAYKYSCFAWGDQRIQKIESGSTTGRKVLVIKDSYGSALVPFLVPNYSTIYVADPKGFNQEGSLTFDIKPLIKDEEIDDVIFCFSIYGSGRHIIQSTLSSLLLK
jgi:hypothetical protein